MIAFELDNERGKGDHRHLQGAEASYAFPSVHKPIPAPIVALKNFRFGCTNTIGIGLMAA